MKTIFNKWRDRVPNKFDDIYMWGDLLNWRFSFLQNMAHRFENNGDNHRIVCLNEAAWVMNKFARVVRKNVNLTDVAVRVLGESDRIIKLMNSETAEHFVRGVELIKCYSKEQRYGDALDIIGNNESIQKLKTLQKIEMLRMRGNVLAELGKQQDANTTYSIAVSHFPQDSRCLTQPSLTACLGKCFYDWALLLDELAELKLL
jgi:transformation/transcription domain-associated protein